MYTRDVSRLPGRAAALALVLILTCLAAAARAQIASTSGDVVVYTRTDVIAVGSVVEGVWESDDEIRVFMEKEDYKLPFDMDVDITADGTYDFPLTPGTLAAGEWVSSVFIHADIVGGLRNLTGRITFSSDILGLVVTPSTLAAWDPVVGLPPVTYPGNVGNRGLELNDAVAPNPDDIELAGNVLDLNLMLTGYTDHVRIILAGNARGISFSLDFQGPAMGDPPSWGPGVIDEGDILTVADPGPPGPNRPVIAPSGLPGVMLEPADLGVLLGGAWGLREVDAWSCGNDRGRRLRFSVDEFAYGRAGGFAPDVRSEGAYVAAGGAQEAAADVFAYRGPIAPTDTFTILGNRMVIDGDGVASMGRPALGVYEPCPATVDTLPDEGDNLDAVDLGTRRVDLQDTAYVYFSLDADYPDWAEPPPANTGTAAANGVSGADILVTQPYSGVFSVYAYAADLGLNTLGEEDDIDAIAIWDDGDAVYEPNIDVILFSLRRGSGSLSMSDCCLGMPITEADVLTPGPGPGPCPCILIPGESLGLDTIRGGLVSILQVPDDIDALDRVRSRSAPVGNNDRAAVDIGGQIQINVLDNDFPLDGMLVPASVTIIDQPASGYIADINPQTGAIVYQHDGDSAEDSFTYIVFDNNGECTEIATVLVFPGGIGIEDGPFPRTQLAFAGPNPFSSRTAFRLHSARAGQARVGIYDLAGRCVRLLFDEMVEAGATRTFAWDGRDDTGQPTAAGMYIVRMRSPEGVTQLRVVRIK